jgi:hypothetical protein
MNTVATISMLIALTAIVCVSIFSVIEALKTGTTGIQGWQTAHRKDNPIWFWICLLFQGGIGVALIIALAVGLNK